MLQVKIITWKQDADVDFVLVPESEAENHLLRAMKGRRVETRNEEITSVTVHPARVRIQFKQP